MTSVERGSGRGSVAPVGQLPASSRERRLLMLYVNIPFCRSKCTFCDYVQPISPADLLLTARDTTRQRYIQALCEEIRMRGRQLSGEGNVPYVLYWGGGTASILEADEIKAVMGALKESFDFDSVAEATIECSPDTVDPDKLSLFRSLGFNRFSSGVQSLDPKRLRQMARLHTADQARQVVRWAREADFNYINIDLMCGFPDETLEEVRYTVSEGLELGVDHLSLYPFRPTPGTTMRRQIDRDSKDLYLELQKAAFQEGRRLITEAGYTEYASGYFGQTSLFNAMYFQLRADIIGFGSGAMSLFDGRFRTHTKGKLHEYISQPTRYDVDLPASAEPVVLSNLRAGLSCFDGVLRDQWQRATEIPLEEVIQQPTVASLIKYFRGRGLVEDERGMRLPASEVGDAFIELYFHVLKQAGRRQGAAAAGGVQ